MCTVNNLQKARTKLAENRAKGTKPLNPIEKAKLNPKSRVLSIAAFCYQCMGMEPGWRNHIRECPSKDCPLFGFRPYK